MTDVIPEDVHQFILHNIDSIAQWEGLLLMRANPETEWNADTIGARLYTAPAEAAKLLSHLHSKGFLVKQKGSQATYRFAPKDTDLEMMITQIAALYRQYLIPITRIIHSKSKSRVQEFADAFRIRKD